MVIFDPYESRQLTGTHAELYRESLRLMVDIFSEGVSDHEHYDPDWAFGVMMFDELHWQQQMRLLISVSQCALDGLGDCEEWSALEKAAFYAVYQNIYQHLEIERDMNSLDGASITSSLEDSELGLGDLDSEYDLFEETDAFEPSWREMISRAYREKCEREGLDSEEIDEYLLTDEEEGEDLGHWASILESLADHILDDRDFEMASTLMDADPEIADAIKRELGIKQDYFIETVPDPQEGNVGELFSELSRLAGIPDGGTDMEAPF